MGVDRPRRREKKKSNTLRCKGFGFFFSFGEKTKGGIINLSSDFPFVVLKRK